MLEITESFPDAVLLEQMLALEGYLGCKVRVYVDEKLDEMLNIRISRNSDTWEYFADLRMNWVSWEHGAEHSPMHQTIYRWFMENM